MAELGHEFGGRGRLDGQTIRKRLRQLRRLEAEEASEAAFDTWRATRPTIGTKPVCYEDGTPIADPEHPGRPDTPGPGDLERSGVPDVPDIGRRR